MQHISERVKLGQMLMNTGVTPYLHENFCEEKFWKAQGHFLFICAWPNTCCQAADFLADPPLLRRRIDMTDAAFRFTFIWIIIFVFQLSLKFRGLL